MAGRALTFVPREELGRLVSITDTDRTRVPMREHRADQADLRTGQLTAPPRYCSHGGPPLNGNAPLSLLSLQDKETIQRAGGADRSKTHKPSLLCIGTK